MADGSLPIEDVPAAETPIKVRLATPDEVDAVMEVAMLATEENGFMKPNPKRMLQEIWSALNLNHGVVGAIGEPGGVIEAAVLLRIGPMWYGDENDLVLEEKAVFTHPAYRSAKGGRASRLIEFSKSYSDSLGLPLIIGVLSHARTRAKVRLYERHFGEPSGAFFLYNAHTGAA